MATGDVEILIDRSLVPEPAPKRRSFPHWRPNAGFITKASKVSNVLVDASLSGSGLIVLIASTASVTFIMAILEFEMGLFQAALPAGCAGLLSPVIVVVAIRLIDLMVRLGFLLVVAALVTALIELAKQVVFGR
jgi:hypothetical protein